MVLSRPATLAALLLAALPAAAGAALPSGSVQVTATIADEAAVAVDPDGAYTGRAGTARAEVTVEHRGDLVIVTVVPQ